MIGVVGAAVVFEGVDLRCFTDAAHGTPVQAAEVDDQIGSDAVDFFVEFLRAIDACGNGEGLAFVVFEVQQFASEFLFERFDIFGRDGALRFASADVEEQAAVISAVAPGFGAAPIDVAFPDGRQRFGTCFEGQSSPRLYEAIR